MTLKACLQATKRWHLHAKFGVEFSHPNDSFPENSMFRVVLIKFSYPNVSCSWWLKGRLLLGMGMGSCFIHDSFSTDGKRKTNLCCLRS